MKFIWQFLSRIKSTRSKHMGKFLEFLKELTGFIICSIAHSIHACNSYLIKSLLSYAKKMLSKSIVTKEPITATHLKELLHIYGNPKNSLKNLRLLTIYFTAYAGFLRYDEPSNLRFSDLKFYNDYVKIFIEKSKTDICRQGFWVHIAKTFKRTCPVAILSNYVRRAKFTDDSDLLLSSVLLFLSGNPKIVF